MKYGEYLHAQKNPEWQHYYLDYDKLKEMIKDLEEIHLSTPSDHHKCKLHSYTSYFLNTSFL
jgi:SPX domain protein involved in polyphosphate accumulation